MATTTSQEPVKRDGALWTGMLGPPVVWLVLLIANLALERHACHAHTNLPYWVSTFVALAIIVGMSLWTVSAGKALVHSDAPNEHARSRFMAMCAYGSCGFFIILTLAFCIPNLIMNPCD